MVNHKTAGHTLNPKHYEIITYERHQSIALWIKIQFDNNRTTAQPQKKTKLTQKRRKPKIYFISYYYALFGSPIFTKHIDFRIYVFVVHQWARLQAMNHHEIYSMYKDCQTFWQSPSWFSRQIILYMRWMRVGGGSIGSTSEGRQRACHYFVVWINRKPGRTCVRVWWRGSRFLFS